MGQLIGLAIIAILAKLFMDLYKQQFPSKESNKKQKKAKKGQVIDISEAWVDTSAMPYNKKNSLLNSKELASYHLLADLLSSSPYIIYPHMRMSEILNVPASTKNRNEYVQRIEERRLDLVIIDSRELSPILAVKLETNNGAKKKQLSDRFTEKVLESAGLPYISLDLDKVQEIDRTELFEQLRKSGLTI